MERRAFLKGAAALGLTAGTASVNAVENASLPLTDEVEGALARFRKTVPANFNSDYVENAVIPFFLSRFYDGEKPMLPMIGLSLSKKNALPYDLWGLLYKDWKPTPSEGETVFLQGLDERGEHNMRKRIYYSAVTPDLYQPMYQEKIAAFFDLLMEPQFADKPFMRHYADNYVDVYWDLHLGVKGQAVPQKVREVGESFNAVLAYRDPLQPIVYEHYMRVRNNIDYLKQWIDERVDDIQTGRVAEPQKTLAWYWLKNSENNDNFSKKDIVFECFHNFVAFNQWGKTLYGIMMNLSENNGDPAVKAAFKKTMSGDYHHAKDAAYTPLDLLVMELFRTISPNARSVSVVEDVQHKVYGERFGLPLKRHSYINTPHTSSSFNPVHWEQPEKFDPDRYLKVPTSAEITEEECKRIGLARCPFDITSMPVNDGRNMAVTNSGFGTVFSVIDDKKQPVCDYAGFAPFGFSYRRCPGEQFTIQVMGEFLTKVWRDKITFHKLTLAKPERVPISPRTVIDDDISFRR
ncbi:twin-arginine translocation signal domain-containing protein [Yersinia nurmii]|uniref:Cytochrome P450 n=1 Tax=Yersinia nurmii TaxID=685706 RepID=A0AAW7K328_9GAMM|nr:twin-arginine translocation signal domain-containing protein [Yersinia nurmii]MDN0089196.1 twin-arginine translocation signal domain-containing protein [Yersinia nurmii]CNF20138.1 Cytochrome P450 [Yersinia nurmii]